MKKLSLSILTVLCAVCFMFGMGLMASVNYASADVAGGAPVLSETKVMRSNDNDKMLLATAIKNYADVYEVGYDFVGEVETTIAENQRFYTSITTGSNEWTAESIFGGDFAGAGLIVWEIEFEVGDSYEFKPYAIYGDRNEQGQLLASGYKVAPEESTVKQFFSVTFTTHDGSEVLSSKIYQKGAEIVAPEKGLTYTIGNDKFEVFYDEMKNASVTTANESATYKVFSEICTPDGMGKGYINIFGDNFGSSKATENTYVSLSAHSTFGNLTTAYNNERVLYRERGAGTGLDNGENLIFYFAPNSVMTELYIPFYIIQGNSLDLGMHAYTMSYNPTLPVKYIDADGNQVNKEDIQNGAWYTAVYTLTDATQKLDQTYRLVLSNGSSVTTKAYIRAPYFGLADGVSVNDFENVKADLGRGFMGKTNSQVVNYIENGELVSKITNGSGIDTPFSNAIAEEYLVAQSEGGKVMRFDVKFDGGWTTYNGVINDQNTYMSNKIRGDRFGNKYVRFYNANGEEVDYASLQEGVWYKWVFDIDAIKTNVGAQSILTGSYAGLSLRIYANESGETISIKNVEFVAKTNENA